MSSKKNKTIGFFYRADNIKASKMAKKISHWLKINYPRIIIEEKNPRALIVLGGDGTILEAVIKYAKVNFIFLGFNMGHVGFLASVRDPKNFFLSLDDFLQEHL